MSCGCGCGCGGSAGRVTFKGTPMTLLGEAQHVGSLAPDFSVVKNDLSEAKLSDFRGKKVLISVVPSLDTGVCDLQTRRFNEAAAGLPNVQILTISMDLPFAQGRWCGQAGVKNLLTLSDHRDADFGLRYGLLIKELRLLTRAILVVDEKGTIIYQEIVPEIANHPNYEAALAAVK